MNDRNYTVIFLSRSRQCFRMCNTFGTAVKHVWKPKSGGNFSCLLDQVTLWHFWASFLAFATNFVGPMCTSHVAHNWLRKSTVEWARQRAQACAHANAHLHCLKIYANARAGAIIHYPLYLFYKQRIYNQRFLRLVSTFGKNFKQQL